MSVEFAETLTKCLDATAGRVPDRPALSLGDRTLTYRELSGAVGACAASLAEMGVGPGQRVAILFPNCPQFVICYYAVVRLGATVVPLHCLQGPEESSYVVANAEAETLIGLNVFEPLIGAVRANTDCLKRVIISGDTELPDVESFEALLGRAPGTVAPDVSAPDAVAVLIYTSGTTGRPKGAMLTHVNLVSNAAASVAVMQISESDVFGSVLPFFHSFGATVCMNMPVLAGGHGVMIPKFAPLSVMETLEEARITVFAGVPSMYAVLLQMKTDREFDLASLWLAVSGGAPLPVEVLRGFEERFDVKLLEGYGPTEASPVVSVNRVDGSRKVGTTGPPLPGVRVRICDDDLNEAPVGEPGEVCVAGPNVMKGYWKNPQGTAETIRDGWLLTGDIGVVDEDGYLSIVDRKKDMIIVGGMNVYPREVEDVIYGLDAIAEAAVIGVPSRLRGEDVRAFVALKDSAELDAQTVIDHCKAHLANYKVPRSVEFRGELPKSAIGKILKRTLRQELAAGEATTTPPS